MLANIDLRRRQMWGVYRHVVLNNGHARDIDDILSIAPVDFLNAALAAGECYSIRDALRKRNVDTKVKNVLRNMKVAMRNVEGSESDQDYLRMKFVAMRIWNGCSAVFFTLNPHDIWSPLLIKFSNGEVFGQQQLRLDWSDEEMQRFYTEAKVKFDDLVFHRIVAEDPSAASKAVHRTFMLTIKYLFNCCSPATGKTKRKCFPDGFPCKCEPGMISFVKGYLGIVEPQMRFTEHVHMLVQVMGFSGPRDFFRGQNFADSFRRVWAFVASITFRSLEGVARYLGTGAACAELQRLPLMRLAKSQQASLGPARVEETEQAQLQARGLVEVGKFHRYWSGGVSIFRNPRFYAP